MICPAGAQTAPASLVYVLQAESMSRNKAAVLEQLANCGRDWVVLDAVFSGDAPWERTDLERIRNGQAGRKVIAYISVGEAEDYRTYWHKEWSARHHDIEKTVREPILGRI